MTEKSVAVTLLTWHGVKISKWKPTNGAPQAVMFQRETRLPLMWSVFWNKESCSFDVHLFPSFALNGGKWIFSSKLDKSVLPLDVFEGIVHLPSKPRSSGVVANTRFLKSEYVLSSFPTLGWACCYLRMCCSERKSDTSSLIAFSALMQHAYQSPLFLSVASPSTALFALSTTTHNKFVPSMLNVYSL